jgi:hypothetical protein
MHHVRGNVRNCLVVANVEQREAKISMVDGGCSPESEGRDSGAMSMSEVRSVGI